MPKADEKIVADVVVPAEETQGDGVEFNAVLDGSSNGKVSLTFSVGEETASGVIAQDAILNWNDGWVIGENQVMLIDNPSLTAMIIGTDAYQRQAAEAEANRVD